MNEKEIIDCYFKTIPSFTSPGLVLGIGDDAALLDIPVNMQLVLSMDTLIEGTHFSPEDRAYDIGYKATAVNFSDLAAMGAQPRWLSLSLSLPRFDPSWLAAFSNGLHGLANRFSTRLIGGDLCKGPLSITIQAHGLVPKGQAIRRDGAKPGDRIYVTGHPGAAGLAWQIRKGLLPGNGDYSLEYQRLSQPEPRVEAGILLREKASSMTDISDGLFMDLGHIVDHPHLGADIYLDQLPMTANMRKLEGKIAWELALTAGDDYELCFTLPEHNTSLLDKIRHICPVTEIGYIKTGTTLDLLLPDGGHFPLNQLGYQHF